MNPPFSDRSLPYVAELLILAPKKMITLAVIINNIPWHCIRVFFQIGVQYKKSIKTSDWKKFTLDLRLAETRNHMPR